MRKQKIKVNDEHPPGYDILKNVAWDLMRIFINFGLKLIKIDSKIITVSNHFRHAWWRKMTHVMIFWRKLTRNSDTKMQNLQHTVPNLQFLFKKYLSSKFRFLARKIKYVQNWVFRQNLIFWNSVQYMRMRYASNASIQRQWHVTQVTRINLIRCWRKLTL